MDFEVAIPSYQRSKKLKDQTLSFLERVNIPKEKITIFLRNNQQAEEYSNDISGYKIVITDTKNLIEKRNFINTYYPEGTKIISIDDDIKDIQFLDQNKNFLSTVERLFKQIEREGCSAFGFYPTTTSNNFYLKERVAFGLHYICFACYGYVNKRLQIPDIYNLCHDHYFSCYMYFTEGKTVRYEGASIKTTYFGKGGLSEARANEDLEKALKYLEEQYPTLVKFSYKKNGRPDVIFKRLKREFKPLLEE